MRSLSICFVMLLGGCTYEDSMRFELFPQTCSECGKPLKNPPSTEAGSEGSEMKCEDSSNPDERPVEASAS